MRRVKIKQWLLLALRVLALACLVLAFARPTLTGRVGQALGGRGSVAAALVVDNSLSMTQRDGQGAYLAQAQRAAGEIAGQMQAGDELFVLATAGDTTRPAPYRAQSAAREAVRVLEAAPGARSATRALGEAAGALSESAHPNRILYFLSDLQASTLGDSLARALPPRPVGSVAARVVSIGTRPPGNVAVTEVEVLSRIIEAGQPVRVRATLRNYGEAPLERYGASLYLEGERVAQAAADLPAEASATVIFTATPQQRGWLAGRVTVEGDAFPPDDERYFTLHVPRTRRLLVVRGAAQNARYVELAFSPELTEGGTALETETIPEGQLAGAPLSAYDAVVLVGPRSLASGERTMLARYVEEGGGLLLFPGTGADLEDYNALLDRLGGGRFEGFIGAPGSEQPVASFGRVDLEHPLFEGLFNPAQDDGRIEEPAVYYAADYAPRAASEQTLIELSSGRPFLQEIRHGQGTALVTAVAPDRAWSDLPVRGLFAPLLYRAAFYLSSDEAGAGASLVAGEASALRLPGVGGEAPLVLVGPEGSERVPEQQRLFGAVLVETSAALRTPGIYEVWQGRQLVRRVALNLDPRESDLAALDADEAARRLAEATGLSVRALDAGAGAARIAEALRTERVGVEIWNVFLLLALAFLVAETVVARQWQPETVAA